MLDFVVIGAGPVGLLCAVALRHACRSVTVLERDPQPRAQTRSIGIHVASLLALDELGLLAPFVARGVRIPRGVAIGARGPLGEIEFCDASARFGYALSIPQPQTEALLEHAARRRGARVVRGACFRELEQHRDHVTLSYERGGRLERSSARYLVGCDGAHSSVRAAIGVNMRERPGCEPPRRRSYLMAEFPRTPQLGDSAWIFLADEGLVESFPLPAGRRRWVLEAPGFRERADLLELCALICERTGHMLDPDTGTAAAAFGIEQKLARQFCCGRALLLGDAAHVLSPFGGQGMNLGWLDAMALAACVDAHWGGAGLDEGALTEWAKTRRRAARVALRQAAWNTRVGRRSPLPRVRNALVRLALAAPASRRLLARRFAMCSLATQTR